MKKTKHHYLSVNERPTFIGVRSSVHETPKQKANRRQNLKQNLRKELGY